MDQFVAYVGQLDNLIMQKNSANVSANCVPSCYACYKAIAISGTMISFLDWEDQILKCGAIVKHA